MGMLEGFYKQVGLIQFGGGLDARKAMDEAAEQGKHVLIRGTYAALFDRVSSKEFSRADVA